MADGVLRQAATQFLTVQAGGLPGQITVTVGAIDPRLNLAACAAPEPFLPNGSRAWGKTSVAERAVVLNKIADRIEQNLEMLAVGETWDNGKPVRETLAADLPLAVDHFRYFAGAIRAQEGGISQLDDNTVAYHFHEPLGVVGQIIPWNFPREYSRRLLSRLS